MKLTAKNEKELALCLKFLYSEGLNNFPIDMGENEHGKLYYNVIVSLNEEQFEILKKKYENLIA
ncbi:MAG: hypothetical protein RR343_06660 [Oscillospiraceae bacterium]